MKNAAHRATSAAPTDQTPRPASADSARSSRTDGPKRPGGPRQPTFEKTPLSTSHPRRTPPPRGETWQPPKRDPAKPPASDSPAARPADEVAPPKPAARSADEGTPPKPTPEHAAGTPVTEERPSRRSPRRGRRKSSPESRRQDRPEPESRQPDRPEPEPRRQDHPPAEDAADPAAPAEPDAPWDPLAFEVPPREDKKRFLDFELPVEILHAVHDLGFRYCTPIQADTLELTLAGRNVAGRAQTGTGKTAAFLIAILRRMLHDPGSRPTQPGRPAALVIGPTRELVIQIARDAEDLGRYCNLRCVAVYGGMDYARQQDQIAAGPVDLMVATPGRLIDFGRSRVVSLKGVHTLVIDEADRMLDMGFIPDVRKIVQALPPKEQRQTLLFSATLTEDVMRLASQWMPDPVQVSVEPENVTVSTIQQEIYPIAAREKFTVLYNLLKREKTERVLVFCNRKISCERLMNRLIDYGVPCEMLSGDVAQKKRLRVLEDFRSGAIKVVVATDVAGRGLHVDDIAYVVNFDFPYEADDYIHRIGRTGRAGNIGTAISFACEDESFIIPEIEKLLGHELSCHVPTDDLFVAPPPPPRGERRHTVNPEDRAPQRDGPRRSGGPRRGPPRGGSGGRPRR